MAEALFAKLQNASWRRSVTIGEATHMLMLEKNRRQLFDEVQLFLEMPPPGGAPGGGMPVVAEAPTAAASFAEAAHEPLPSLPVSSSSTAASPAGSPPPAAEHTPAPLAGAAADRGERPPAASAIKETGTNGSSQPPAEATMPRAEVALPSPKKPSAAVAALIERGDELFAIGDVYPARLYYTRAADAGDPHAMTALGKTYDPVILGGAGVRGIRPDPAVASQWYRKAMEGGDSEAASLLDREGLARQ
jgi:TPR repeat protein